MRTCEAKTKYGQPCRAQARETGFCFAHDPELAEKRHSAKSNGGMARHGRRIGEVSAEVVASLQIADGETLSISDVAALVSGEIAVVLQMERSHARARTVGYLASQLIKLYEASALVDRVAMLEKQLGINDPQIAGNGNGNGHAEHWPIGA